MDKAKAMERLDAIEAEAKKLRKIIDRKKIEYNSRKLYVGIMDGAPYILLGIEGHWYAWYNLTRWLSEQAYTSGHASGQEAINYALREGFDIQEFSDTREAFKYFLDNYKG